MSWSLEDHERRPVRLPVLAAIAAVTTVLLTGCGSGGQVSSGSALAAGPEVSVVVAHAEHLRGVGTALLRRLGEIARENGLHHLVAEVLWENQHMLRVLADAGWPCTRRLEDSVLHVDVDLTADIL